MIGPIAHALSLILIPLFLVGMAGSLVVVAITIVQDLREVVTEDEVIPTPEKVVSAR